MLQWLNFRLIIGVIKGPHGVLIISKEEPQGATIRGDIVQKLKNEAVSPIPYSIDF